MIWDLFKIVYYADILLTATWLDLELSNWIRMGQWAKMQKWAGPTQLSSGLCFFKPSAAQNTRAVGWSGIAQFLVKEIKKMFKKH